MQGLTLQRSWFSQLRCRARLLPSVIWIEKAVNLLPDKHPSRHICQGHPGLHGQTRGQNFVKRITEAVPRGDRSPCKAEGEVRKTAWNVGQTEGQETGTQTEECDVGQGHGQRGVSGHSFSMVPLARCQEASCWAGRRWKTLKT